MFVSYLALTADIVLMVVSIINPIQAQQLHIKKPVNIGSIVTASVTLFGVDNTTGNVITWVTVKELTKAIVSNATAIDLRDGNPNGFAGVLFKIPSTGIKDGDEIKACNLVLKNLDIVCTTTQKPFHSNTVFLQLFLNKDSK